MRESPDDMPSFAELAADPEIAALLDFEPVPRKTGTKDAWTPDLQRQFIALLAITGSPGKACAVLGKDRTGIRKIFDSPLGASFREAWEGAVALATRRGPVLEFVKPGTTPPAVDHRFKVPHPRAGEGADEGEGGETEGERRFAEARESIVMKLLRARRLYLQEICVDPAKRAAFEILTELPVDWAKAKRLEAQPDEPWRPPNLRTPDMLMTVEAGWLSEVTGGANKKAELMRVINAWRVKHGQAPIVSG